jgi:inhibitor of KinA
MNDEQIRIFPLGDSGLTVEFGQEISIALNDQAVALAKYLDNNAFQGYVESVPAYASVAVYYDPLQVRASYPKQSTAFASVLDLVLSAIAQMKVAPSAAENVVEISVIFGGEAGPDLDVVAEHSKLDPAEVLSIFTGTTYKVFMLGFLPGFAYLGELDNRIASPRRDTPRTSVPAGSVGIAGKQTGIYALDSPGGWQIIGRTNIEMFTPEAETPCRLSPGDRVRFIAA